MGCFFACFGKCKHRKRRHLVNATQSEEEGEEERRNETSETVQLDDPTKQEATEKPITESKPKLQELLRCSTTKNMTFDLDVKKTSEELFIEEATDNLVKNNEKKDIDNLVENDKDKEDDDLVKNNEKKKSDNLVKNNEKKVGDDLLKSNAKEEIDDLVKNNESNGSDKKEETPEAVKLVSDAITPNVISFVPNHRYQNCATSEDEYEDLDLEESDLNDGNDDMGSDEQMKVQEESSESLFSLSIESRKQVSEVELGEKEVNSPMPKCGGNQEIEEIALNGNAGDTSQYVHSVLNPVENLTQWKAAKAKPTLPSKYQDKENMNLGQDPNIPTRAEPSFKLSKPSSNNKNGEIAVDTSLSSWLVESETEQTTPMSKTSSVSVGNSLSENTTSPRTGVNKLVLGALTVEEVKQISAVSSSPRSRSCEEPKIGTIGSYWSHTGKFVDSDSGSSSQGMLKTRWKNTEDEKVNWQSTPLRVRFESWVEF